jgi:hypothetical protein
LSGGEQIDSGQHGVAPLSEIESDGLVCATNWAASSWDTPFGAVGADGLGVVVVGPAFLPADSSTPGRRVRSLSLGGSLRCGSLAVGTPKPRILGSSRRSYESFANSGAQCCKFFS